MNDHVAAAAAEGIQNLSTPGTQHMPHNASNTTLPNVAVNTLVD